MTKIRIKSDNLTHSVYVFLYFSPFDRDWQIGLPEMDDEHEGLNIRIMQLMY